MLSLSNFFRPAQLDKSAATALTPTASKGHPVELKPQDLRNVTGGLPAIGGLGTSLIGILPT